MDDFLQQYLQIELHEELKVSSEYEDFVNMINSLIDFYNNYTVMNIDNEYIRVYMINNLPLDLDMKFYEDINSSLEYAKSNNFRSVHKVISYIAYTLKNSIEYDVRDGDACNRARKEKFYSAFTKKDFFNNGLIFNSAITFTKDFLDYITESCLESGVIGFEEVLNAVNILYISRDTDLSIYVKKFIKFENSLLMNELIIFDLNIAQNKDFYFEQYLKYAFEGRGANLKIIAELFQKSLISEIYETKIIDKLKNVCKKISDNSCYDMQRLVLIKNIINEIDNLKDYKSASVDFKEQIKAISIELQYIRRKTVENFDDGRIYWRLNEIPSIENFVAEQDNMLEEDLKLYLLQCITIDVDQFIDLCVDFIKNEPELRKYISHSTIDQDNNLVFNRLELIEKNNYITQYYQKIFLEKTAQPTNENIFKLFSEHLHLYSSGLYSVTKRLMNKFPQDNLYNIVDKTKIDKKFFTKHYYDNHQIFILIMIQGIEFEICELYNLIFNEDKKAFEEKFLFKIFQFTVEKKENEDKNNILQSLWFVYYMIYSSHGKNIRNKYSHGNVSSCEKNYMHVYIVLSCYFHIGLLGGTYFE